MALLADPRLRAAAYLNSMVGDVSLPVAGHAMDALPVSIAEHWGLENRSADKRRGFMFERGDFAPGREELGADLAAKANRIQSLQGQERIEEAQMALAEVLGHVQTGLISQEQADGFAETFRYLATPHGQPAAAGGSGGGGGGGGGRTPTKPGDPDWKPGGGPAAGGEEENAITRGMNRMAGMRLRDKLAWGAAGSGAIAGTAALVDLLTPDQQPAVY